MKRSRKPLYINVLGDARQGTLGTFRTGQGASISRRTGRVSSRNGLSASFTVKEGYALCVDARSMLMATAEAAHKQIVNGLKGGYDPGTGRKHPASARITDEMRAHMIKSLRRTITASTRNWGGGFKKLDVPQATVKFYFEGRKARAINKDHATRGGKDKAVRLSVKGSMAVMFQRGLQHWARRCVEGKIMPVDSRARAHRKR